MITKSIGSFYETLILILDWKLTFTRLLLFLNSVTLDFLIKFMLSVYCRVDKSLVHEICRSFLSRSTLSLKKKKKKKKEKKKKKKNSAVQS